MILDVDLGGETALIDGQEQYLSRPVVETDGVSYLALDDYLTLHKLKIETLF